MNQYILKIFESKNALHKAQKNMSFEEKIKSLIELQKISLEFRKMTNKEIKPYEIVWRIDEH